MSNHGLRSKKYKNEWKYTPFTSNTFIDDKIALYNKLDNVYVKSPLYGSIFKLDEAVKNELENIWTFQNNGKWRVLDLTKLSRNTMKNLTFKINSGIVKGIHIPLNFNFEINNKKYLIMDSENRYMKADNISMSEQETAQHLADDLIDENYRKLASKNLGETYFNQERFKLPDNFVLRGNELRCNLDYDIKMVL